MRVNVVFRWMLRATLRGAHEECDTSSVMFYAATPRAIGKIPPIARLTNLPGQYS